MPISMTEALQGYRAAVEAPLAQQEAKDRASIISGQAALQREAAAARKEASYLANQKRATISDLAQKHRDINLADTQGQLKLADIAIQQNRNNPVLMTTFQEDKQNLLKRQAEEMKVQASLREEERAKNYDVLSTALADPASAESLLSSGNPTLQHFGEMILDKKPILQFRDSSGKPKLYSQLSEEEQTRFSDKVLSGVAPKGDAATLARYMQHEIDWAKQAEKARHDQEETIRKQQDSALKRDKVVAKDKEQEDKNARQRATFTRQRDNDLKKIEDQQQAILTAAGVSSSTEKEKTLGFEHGGLSAADKATYDTLEAQKQRVIQTHEENLATLSKEGTTPPPKKESISPYTSAQDVKAAFQSGKISREEAKKHLLKFGFK